MSKAEPSRDNLEKVRMSSEQRALFEAAAANPPPYPMERFDGRGIVICAGGARLFTCAYVAIGILRRVLGCRLPIQLWHLGPDEIGPPMAALLETWGVELVDALEVAKRFPMRMLGGWEIKPYAIVHSRFREVFLLDADNVPVVDPAELYDLRQYAETGAVFWPDFTRLRADNPIWEICGVPYRSLPSVESGQLLLDKERCWRALQLTLHMNAHSDFFYQHLYGDKDTFLMAWLRLGQSYAMTPHSPIKSQAVLYQRDFEGRRLFQHRNGAKWVYGSGNPRIEGFALQDECFALLAELQDLWNGRILKPPAMGPMARQAAEAIEGIGWFDYRQVGSSERRLQFLPANRIGQGRGEDAVCWWVEENGEGAWLVIEGRRYVACRLRQQADGSWHGRSAGPDAWETDLIPLPAVAPAGDPALASAAALLDMILAAPSLSAGDGAAMQDLSAALRLLAQTAPGFPTALGQRAERAPDDAIGRCLRAASAWAVERLSASPAPLPIGRHNRKPIYNLGYRYEHEQRDGSPGNERGAKREMADE